jgi:hypothetical protein
MLDLSRAANEGQIARACLSQVAAGNICNETAKSPPSSSNAPTFPASAADSVPSSLNDSSRILVTLAGQERRVLELKEEI